MFNNVRRISLFDEKSLNSTSSDTASMWNDFPSVPSDLPPLPADSVPSVPSLPSIASDVEVEQPAPSNYNYETHGIDEDHPGPDSERIVELQSDIHDKLGELMTNKSDQDVLSAAEALHGESNNIPFLEHLLDDLNKNGIEGEAYKDALDLSNRLGILPDKAALCDAAEPWQLGFQDAASPMMQGIIDLHHDIFFFLILILVFVSRILVRALWHFHYQKNPIPQRIVHGTTIEILRTIFPSIIPMFIAIPSFALLYSMGGALSPLSAECASSPSVNGSSSTGWTSLLGSTSQEPSGVSSPRGVLSNFEQEASSRGSSVNMPLPAEQAVPPANPVASGEAEAGPSHVAHFPYDEAEVIGGDSVLSIRKRLLARNQNPFPSAEELRIAHLDAQDRFEVKADIAMEMSAHDPTGDWLNRGARALDNPRTKTGEDSLENLFIIRDKLRQRDWETIKNLQEKMVFRRG